MTKYSKEKEQEILQSYKQGKSISEIAKHYNSYNTSIKRVLNRNGIFYNLTKSEHRTSVKINPFLDLNNPEVQYWLGMIVTDGNIYKTRISLDCGEKDLEHLKKYHQFTKTTNIINKSLSKKFNTYQYSVRFKNEEIAKYLISLGIHENKSYTVKVNFPITYDFLRGVIDGDGCIEIKKDSKKLYISIVTASEDFKNQLSNFLALNNYKHGIYKTKNHNVINISAKKDVVRLCYNLYKGANTFLERKKSKYLTHLNNLNLTEMSVANYWKH